MNIFEWLFLIALVIYIVDTNISILSLDSEADKIRMQVIEHDKEIKEIEKKLKKIYDSIKDDEECY